MIHYQLPILKDDRQFEEFICDLFNLIAQKESVISTDYQIFGVRGQKQMGIDILSSKTQTAIQCKLKDIRKNDGETKQILMRDIERDLSLSKQLEITLDRFIFVSTFRDDTFLQQFVYNLKSKHNLSFDLCYWGWDTISRHASQHQVLLKKYFPLVAVQYEEEPENVLDLAPRIQSLDQLKQIIKGARYSAYIHDEHVSEKQMDELNAFFDKIELLCSGLAHGVANSENKEIWETCTDELERMGFVFFGERRKNTNHQGNEIDAAMLYAMRKNNPRIIKFNWLERSDSDWM